MISCGCCRTKCIFLSFFLFFKLRSVFSQRSRCSALPSHEAATLFKRSGASLALATFGGGIIGRKNIPAAQIACEDTPPFSNVTCALRLPANLQIVQFSLSLFLCLLTIFMWLWPARCGCISVINTPLRGAAEFQRFFFNYSYHIHTLNQTWGKEFMCVWCRWYVQYVSLSHDPSTCFTK